MSISVLMSVYKSEKPAYLSCALKSVWDDQTLKPDEIILIEDGPLGEELLNVIDNFKNILGSKLKILVNKENLGLTKSLNLGLKIATGDYIARMDSDDISRPNRFEKQLNFMASHPEISVVGAGMQEFDENGEWGAERLYPLTDKNIRKYIIKANPIAHPTAFFNRNIFDNGVKYDERYRKNQDLKLWFDLLSNGYKLNNIPDILLEFRRTTDTYSKRSSKISLKSELEIYLNGITQMHGKLSWKKIFPIIRYAVKSMPPGVNEFVYKYLFKKKNR